MFKMLVIDDEYLVRLGIRQAIPWERHGIVVVGEAANGQQGLELALQRAPDVILCDVRMPVMDGIAFVRRVQELGLDCAVVILSGYKEFDYVKGTLEGGAFAYLLKPIDDDELIETVRRALQQLEQRRRAIRREQHWQQVLPSVAQSLLLKLIAGDASGARALQEILEAHGFPVGRRGHLIVGQADPDPSDSEGAPQAVRALHDQLEQGLREQGAPHLGVLLESHFVVLAGMEDGDLVQRVCEAAVARYEQAGAATTVTVGISQAYADLRGVEAAYRQAREAARSKLFPLVNAVVRYGAEGGPYKPQVLAAMRYIAEHYAEDVTVRDVAAHLHVSESYLMHLFRENVGLTFNECLTAYRMMMAKKMLREGKYRVYEIAERVGYSDPKYFSQVFRKHTGLLPSQYRG